MKNTSKNTLLERVRTARARLTEKESDDITAAAKTDKDNPPLTEEQLTRARGRPPLPKGERKVRVTMMLDLDVVDHFKAGGKGWQTRVNDALREYSLLSEPWQIATGSSGVAVSRSGMLAGKSARKPRNKSGGKKARH